MPSATEPRFDIWQSIQGAIRSAANDEDNESSVATIAATEFHSRLSELGVVPHEFHPSELRLKDQHVPVGVGFEDVESDSLGGKGPDTRGITVVLYSLVGKPGAATIESYDGLDGAAAANSAIRFFLDSQKGRYDTEDYHPAREFAERLRPTERISKLAIVLLVLGNLDNKDRFQGIDSSLQDGLADIGIADIDIQAWDCREVNAAEHQDGKGGTVTVDFVEYGYGSLECVAVTASATPVTGLLKGEGSEYRTYLAAIPGDLLADLYDIHGGRLLERNVRSFLQTRRKVNRGIQETIANAPNMFLAYNNGLTITAAEVVLDAGRLRRLVDLQIVNGGQTTGSLHFAKYKANKRLDLSQVFVQAKICVVDLDKSTDFVDTVARYSNSQNKVTEADLASSQPIHKELHGLSRDNANVAHDGTRWFYEDVRGRYESELARLAGDRLARFRRENPKSQVITKLDMAKTANCWSLRPDAACKGAEKSHLLFLERLKSQPSSGVTNDDFRDVVAKVILFRSIDAIVKGLDLGGYKSETVAHTFAAARRIMLNDALEWDLAQIWNNGRIGPGTELFLEPLALAVRTSMIKHAAERNIAEWAKKRECHDLLVTDRSVTSIRYKTVLGSETRRAVEDSGWAATAVLDCLRLENRALNKGEILALIGGKRVISDGEWDRARAFLLDSGQIEQVSGRRSYRASN